MNKQAYSAYENSNKDKPPPQYSSPILRISEEVVEKEISFTDKDSFRDVTCYRCGLKKHLQCGCRVR